MADGTACTIDTGHDAGKPNEPIRFHGPPILTLEVHAHGLHKVWRCMGVAEDPVSDTFMKRFDDGMRSAEIHIRYPQRNHITPSVSVPFGTESPSTIDGGVEIVGNAAMPWLILG
jgi:hypothetical protein